jgi:hypothetical protein
MATQHRRTHLNQLAPTKLELRSFPLSKNSGSDSNLIPSTSPALPIVRAASGTQRCSQPTPPSSCHDRRRATRGPLPILVLLRTSPALPDGAGGRRRSTALTADANPTTGPTTSRWAATSTVRRWGKEVGDEMGVGLWPVESQTERMRRSVSLTRRSGRKINRGSTS